MTSSDIPAEVRALVEAREKARAAKDFGVADRLRDQIGDAGYEIVDGPGGSTIQARAQEGQGPFSASQRLRAEDVEDVSHRAPAFDVSVQWVVQGWPEDVFRGIEAFRAHEGSARVQYVVVDCLDDAEPVAWPDDVEVVALRSTSGWGSARNAGLRRTRGAVVVIVDGSIEPTGDVCTPLQQALVDPSVGLTGPFAIVTDDLREFDATDGPEADAIEGYLMALRVETLRLAGGFDEKFTFYRTADIEYSFRVKDLGLRATVTPLTVRKHEHRMWHSTPEAQRRRLSRKNFNRFLDRWRGRSDLTVAGQATNVSLDEGPNERKEP